MQRIIMTTSLCAIAALIILLVVQVVSAILH
jgi:hypothetical protein